MDQRQLVNEFLMEAQARRDEFPPDHPLMRGSDDEDDLSVKAKVRKILNHESISDGSKSQILQMIQEIEEESEYKSRRIEDLMNANHVLSRKYEDAKNRLIRATRSGSWNF